MPSQAEVSVEKLEEKLKNRPESLVFSRLADLYRKTDDVQKAITICESGLQIHPEYVTGRIILARCYNQLENYEDAIKEFINICKLDRRNQISIKMLADIFSKQGMQEKTGDLYNLLYRMDPDNSSLEHLTTVFQGSGKTNLFEILGIEEAPVESVETADISDTMSQDVMDEVADVSSETQGEVQEQFEPNIESTLPEESDLPEEIEPEKSSPDALPLETTDMSVEEIAETTELAENESANDITEPTETTATATNDEIEEISVPSDQTDKTIVEEISKPSELSSITETDNKPDNAITNDAIELSGDLEKTPENEPESKKTEGEYEELLTPTEENDDGILPLQNEITGEIATVEKTDDTKPNGVDDLMSDVSNREHEGDMANEECLSSLDEILNSDELEPEKLPEEKSADTVVITEPESAENSKIPGTPPVIENNIESQKKDIDIPDDTKIQKEEEQKKTITGIPMPEDIGDRMDTMFSDQDDDDNSEIQTKPDLEEKKITEVAKIPATVDTSGKSDLIETAPEKKMDTEIRELTSRVGDMFDEEAVSDMVTSEKIEMESPFVEPEKTLPIDQGEQTLQTVIDSENPLKQDKGAQLELDSDLPLEMGKDTQLELDADLPVEMGKDTQLELDSNLPMEQNENVTPITVDTEIPSDSDFLEESSDKTLQIKVGTELEILNEMSDTQNISIEPTNVLNMPEKSLEETENLQDENTIVFDSSHFNESDDETDSSITDKTAVFDRAMIKEVASSVREEMRNEKNDAIQLPIEIETDSNLDAESTAAVSGDEVISRLDEMFPDGDKNVNQTETEIVAKEQGDFYDAPPTREIEIVDKNTADAGETKILEFTDSKTKHSAPDIMEPVETTPKSKEGYVSGEEVATRIDEMFVDMESFNEDSTDVPELLSDSGKEKPMADMNVEKEQVKTVFNDTEAFDITLDEEFTNDDALTIEESFSLDSFKDNLEENEPVGEFYTENGTNTEFEIENKQNEIKDNAVDIVNDTEVFDTTIDEDIDFSQDDISGLDISLDSIPDDTKPDAESPVSEFYTESGETASENNENPVIEEDPDSIGNETGEFNIILDEELDVEDELSIDTITDTKSEEEDPVVEEMTYEPGDNSLDDSAVDMLDIVEKEKTPALESVNKSTAIDNALDSIEDNLNSEQLLDSLPEEDESDSDADAMGEFYTEFGETASFNPEDSSESKAEDENGLSTSDKGIPTDTPVDNIDNTESNEIKPTLPKEEIVDSIDTIFVEEDIESVSVLDTIPDDDLESDDESVGEFYNISGDDAINHTDDNREEEDVVVLSTSKESDTKKDTSIAIDKSPTEKNNENDNDDDYEEDEGDQNAVFKADSIPDHVITPTLADIYYQQDQPYFAIQIYKRLLQRDPDNDRIRDRIAQIELVIKEKESLADLNNDDENSSAKKSKSTKTNKKIVAKKKSKPLKGIKIKKKVKERIKTKKKKTVKKSTKKIAKKTVRKTIRKKAN